MQEYIERARIATQEYGKYLDERHFQVRKKFLDVYNKTDKCKAVQKRYAETEKGQIAGKRRNCIRRARYRHLIKKLSCKDLEDIRLFYCACPEGYEVDHIMPISKGGKHHISNLQYLTKWENRSKGAKIEWKQEGK